MTKFELTDITMEHDGVTLHRVEYVDGSIGGWVEKPENIAGDAKVLEEAKVFGDAVVHGNALVYGSAEVYGNAVVFDWAVITGDAKVFGNAGVYGSAKVYGNAEVAGTARVYDSTKVYGNARVYGDAVVCGDAVVKSLEDYVVFKNWWSSGRYFTWTRSNNRWRVGCFYGTGKQLVEKAYQDSEVSGREYERVVRYVESLLSESSEWGIKK